VERLESVMYCQVPQNFVGIELKTDYLDMQVVQCAETSQGLPCAGTKAWSAAAAPCQPAAFPACLAWPAYVT